MPFEKLPSQHRCTECGALVQTEVAPLICRVCYPPQQIQPIVIPTPDPPQWPPPGQPWPQQPWGPFWVSSWTTSGTPPNTTYPPGGSVPDATGDDR